MTAVEVSLTCEKLPGGVARVGLKLGANVLHVDEIQVARQEERVRFVEAAIATAPALDAQRDELESRLLDLAGQHDAMGQADAGGKTGRMLVQTFEPLRFAEHFLEHCAKDSEGRYLLRRYAGSFWRWEGASYRELTDEDAAVSLYAHLDRLETPIFDKDGNESGRRKVIVNSKLVREVALALPSRGILLNGHIPFWITRPEPAPDPREIVVCRNGIVDLQENKLIAATPELFITNSLSIDYHPNCEPPGMWLDFLNDLWGDDPQSIECLQEWFGYLLTCDTRQQKMLLLVGPRRSGKGTIGRVLTELVGAANVTSPTLANLATEFGMQDLLGKSVALVSDARLTGRVDQTAVVERLLTISGQDSIVVNRKYRPPITTRLNTRFVIMTNELPKLTDVSGALAGRFIVLQTRRSFYGKEAPELTDRLLRELPGILRWSLEGRRRLAARAAFRQPESSRELLQVLEELASPVSLFLKECCVLGAGKQVLCGVLYDRWVAWCTTNGVQSPGTTNSFSRDLHAAEPLITTRQLSVDGSRSRIYSGVGLRGDG